MIDGVKIRKITTHTHDRGNFREILRDDDKLLKKFGQASMTVTYPGVIKAFHWHKKQDDLWFFAQGKAMVVLHDLREGSPTKGETQTILSDESDPQLILIPVGVVHGYKVLGDKPVLLFYHTTEGYNAAAPDEERLAFDDPKINFNWNNLE